MSNANANRQTPPRQPSEDTREESVPMDSAMGGASDGTSGGGAGAGIPGSDLDMASNGRFDGGDVKKDAEKLFPERAQRTSDRPGT